VVHFATHGIINSQHPELSGIVLSLVDQNGQPQNGYLRLYDLYNLKLSADLVVLSACQTALGKEIRGEGLVGLTRGFMYAGAPRVIASLWQIDDRASAEFMKRFYEAMLGQKLRPAAALRAAQVTMSKDPRWREPHYWAAFTLQGEWN
jgi:CHAT domain-containing protein